MASGPVILLRSGWQTVNIGDIAHTPGAVQFLEAHFPDAHVILWANSLDRGAQQLLERHVPRLEIHDSPDPGVLPDLIERADLFIAGSGSRFPAKEQVATWRDHTRKPYGLLGVTVDEVSEETRPLLDGAAFCYLRETESVRVLREAGVASPVVAFGPDATWAMRIADEPAAQRRLDAAGLSQDGFLCVIPRLRYTPYHQIYPDRPGPQARAAHVDAHNARFIDADMMKLRTVITRWVRETGRKVLLCPEMTYQLDLLEPHLTEPLPDDVRASVVPMTDFWLPDEASSIYARAAAVVSCECHSPIMAIVNGTPAFYVRQPEDTIKGQMYPDLGLGDWMYEIDTAAGEEIADDLLKAVSDPGLVRSRIESALGIVQERLSEAASTISQTLSNRVI